MPRAFIARTVGKTIVRIASSTSRSDRTGAGETAPMHSHPERVTVAIRGAKLRMTDANGKTETVEVKTGEATHLDAQTHTVTNIGTTTFEEVSTEFVTPMGKQPPDTHVWVLGGEAPAFVKLESSLYVGGPIWRIQLAGAGLF